MEEADRLVYVNEISGGEGGFSEKLGAILDDMWTSMSPHAWKLVLSILLGGVGGVLLVWFVKKTVVAVAYSVVGTTAAVLGIQTALLGIGIRAVSALNSHRLALPMTWAAMVAIGCLCQLVLLRPLKPESKKQSTEK